MLLEVALFGIVLTTGVWKARGWYYRLPCRIFPCECGKCGEVEVSDYLLDEFHEAGIWLVEEKRPMERVIELIEVRSGITTMKGPGKFVPGQILEYGPKCGYRYREDIMKEMDNAT